MTPVTDPTTLEAYRSIYSLEYCSEDVATVAGDMLTVLVPHLEQLAKENPSEALRLATALLEAVGEKLRSTETLASCFPAYCALIGAEWVED